MRRRSELIGLLVLTKDGARRLGQVADVLVSASDGRVIGLLLTGGSAFLGHRVYPYEEVAAIGNGAVLVNSESAVISTRDGGKLKQLLARHNEVVGKRILSESGDDLGVVADLVFDPDTGRVLGYEVSGGVVQDIVSGRRFLSVGSGLTPGEEAIICECDWRGDQS